MLSVDNIEGVWLKLYIGPQIVLKLKYIVLL